MVFVNPRVEIIRDPASGQVTQVKTTKEVNYVAVLMAAVFLFVILAVIIYADNNKLPDLASQMTTVFTAGASAFFGATVGESAATTTTG